MCIEVAVSVAEFSKARLQHAKVLRLIRGHAGPVAVVIERHAAEAIYRIPGQIDCVEFDMRDRVHERGTAFVAAETALRQLAWFDQMRADGTPRLRYRARRITAVGCEFGRRADRARRRIAQCELGVDRGSSYDGLREREDI